MGLRNHVPATHSGQFEFSKVRFAETRVLVESSPPGAAALQVTVGR